MPSVHLAECIEQFSAVSDTYIVPWITAGLTQVSHDTGRIPTTQDLFLHGRTELLVLFHELFYEVTETKE
jgi:hypothetical protein